MTVPRTSDRRFEASEDLDDRAADEAAHGAASWRPEPPPLHLTLLWRGGRIAAMLTDLRGLARMDEVDVAAALLASLRHTSDVLLRGSLAGLGEAPVFASVAADALDAQEFGRRVFCLLPSGVGAILRAAPAGALALQLDRQLAALPWELAFDGTAFLGAKLRVSRRVVAEDGARGVAASRPAPSASVPRPLPFKVLLLTPDPSGTAVAEAKLAAPLRALGAVEVSTVDVDAWQSDGLLALIGAHDFVHWIGPGGAAAAQRPTTELESAAGALPALAAIAGLAAAPLWLGVQTTTVDAATVAEGAATKLDGATAEAAEAASRLGLELLSLHSLQGLEHGFAFMVAWVEALLRGASAGVALRAARSTLQRRFGAAALVALRPEWTGDAAAVLHAPSPPTVADALRQLTIVSVDLVESTRLLAALGAERYGDVLSDYQRRCAALMRSHGGVPDDFQGDDGAMCYFGLPVAREDAAVQALRAALALVDAVRTLGLGVRIGVVTGQVVIRDGQPIGVAVHLAARLQAIAAPGTIVVGEATRQIAADRFQFQPLEKLARLKGFDSPQRCFLLLAQTPHAVHALAGLGHVAPGSTPFVGRTEELAALGAHWAAVERGALRVVEVRGEAGIGKSRLVREFRRKLAAAGPEVLEARCAPEHVHSAFYPLIESLRSQLRIAPGDAAPAVLSRLRAMVLRGGEGVDEASIALLADLLGIAAAVRHPVLDQSAERRRQSTIELLVTLAERRVRDRSACLIVEDVQWLDPSTAEYLGRLATATRDRRLMLILTVRSEEASRWRPLAEARPLELGGLSPELSRALVLATCGEQRLAGELVQRIAARGDGVPLFIEESTRMALEREAGQGGDGQADMPVPTTILDLLTARLDALGAAKRIAQIGGTIGREFSLTLLQAVLEHAGSSITAGDALAELAELVRAGVLLARRDSGDTGFMFRHALLRDAAYRSLLERDRLRLHQVIAAVVADRFQELAERQPQLLAFHYTEARQDALALGAWESAVRHASVRSAHAEAVGYLDSALGVLARLPLGIDRDRIELKLQLLLAARLLATHGYGAERVQRAYARAMALAEALGDGSAAIRVLLGFESYHFMRADFANAERCVHAASDRVPKDGHAIHQVQTRWALATIQMHRGDMESSVQRMDACRAEYDQLAHRPDLVQDPGVMCLCYTAWSLWQLGFPDEALSRVLAVTARAEDMRHAFSLGEAYGFKAAVQHFRGENREALASAEQAIAICEENGFSVWLAHARLMRGRIAAELGRVEDGIAEMREGYERWATTGAIVTTPFYLTMRAEGSALAGRPEECMALLEEALEIAERTGERYYEPEIRRLIGCTTRQLAVDRRLDRAAEAERWMRQAFDCARARSMASLALRSALSLADLWTSHGRHDQAVAMLGSAHEWVIGGYDTRDVATARARLAALRNRAAS